MSAGKGYSMRCMRNADIGQFIKDLAAGLGFDRCGITAAEPIGRAAYFRRWLDAGRAGSMEYLHSQFKKRVDARELLSGAKSVIVVALSYYQPDQTGLRDDHSSRGRVAKYAWGDDYHTVVKEKLFAMADRMRGELAEAFEAKACVDTAPLVERELAAAAGIGWIGKNTMVLDQRAGSYFFLGALVTTLELPADEPVTDHCGTCTACLDACPTNAFPAPYEMDASRCISYLTIEHRGDIPRDLKPKMGNWIFGCDVCQEVCPYNRDPPVTGEPRFAVRSPGPQPKLDEILNWSIEDYRKQLRGSAMKRAKLDMLKRNSGIARDNLTQACS